mmetsp:Transcript_14882/g.30071  ORF Transcript_14882/g.30071 Transcript_14882/m.30071 type:complete len:81 (-) Transcript_14882:458-700(-)
MKANDVRNRRSSISADQVGRCLCSLPLSSLLVQKASADSLLLSGRQAGREGGRQAAFAVVLGMLLAQVSWDSTDHGMDAR